MVQHRAVRYIFNDYQHTSSIISMLNKLSLPTLEKRRKISSLTMFHKIYHRKVRINFPTYIKPTLRNRFSIPYSRTNAHKSSFFPRTERLWNDLPPDLSSCPDLEAFRAGLAHHLNWPPSNISPYIHHIITIHPSSSISHHPSLPTSHHPSLPISHHPSLPIYYHVNFTVWSPSRVPISKPMLNS